VASANVDIVRRAIEAFTRRDLDAALRDLDAEAVVDWSRSRGLEAGVYRGYEAIRDFWSTFLDVFANIEVTEIEFIESNDHVVAPNRMRARGRDGIQVDARYVAVVRLRGGRIVDWRLYLEKEEALAAVGLEQ
jgi:ketosteroid isomerase-like protein